MIRSTLILMLAFFSLSSRAGTEVGNGRTLPEPRGGSRVIAIPGRTPDVRFRVLSTSLSHSFPARTGSTYSLRVDLRSLGSDPAFSRIIGCALKLSSPDLKGVTLTSDRCIVERHSPRDHALLVEWDLPARTVGRVYSVESFDVLLHGGLGPVRTIGVPVAEIPGIEVIDTLPTRPISWLEGAMSPAEGDAIRLGQPVRLEFWVRSLSPIIGARLGFSLSQFGFEDKGSIPLIPGMNDAWISSVSFTGYGRALWKIEATLRVPAGFTGAESLKITEILLTAESLRQATFEPDPSLEARIAP